MRLITITTKEARALRADVVSSSDIARKRVRCERRLVAPFPVTVRIGEPPNRDWKHMDIGDLSRHNRRHPRYMKRPPYCRACAKPIRDGEKAISFALCVTPDTWGRTAYIHLDACEGG